MSQLITTDLKQNSKDKKNSRAKSHSYFYALLSLKVSTHSVGILQLIFRRRNRAQFTTSLNSSRAKMALFIDPFDVLLSEISNDLNQDNLRSLIQVCRYYITESQRERIKDGLEVFEILRRRDKVTSDRDKICNLLEIIKALRPKRRDLVRKVENFIKDRYVDLPERVVIIDYTPDVQELESSTSSEDGLTLSKSDQEIERPRSTSFTLLSRALCCKVDCDCCAFNCYSKRVPPWVYGTLSAVLASVAVIIAVLAWTEHVIPSKVGKYGTSVLGALAVFLLFLCFRARRHKTQSVNFSSIVNSYGSINEGTSWQESEDSIRRHGTVARDINRKRKVSQSTSGCSSRNSQKSVVTTPPSVQSTAAINERICEHCVGGCPNCGQLPIYSSRNSKHYIQSNSFGRQPPPSRTPGCRPDFVLCDPVAVSDTGSQPYECQRELDHDVKPDVMVHRPGHGVVDGSETLSHSCSSGIFFLAAEEDAFHSIGCSDSEQTN